MKFNDKSIIKPCPSDDLLDKKEKKWKIKLPREYKEFMKSMNGIEVISGYVRYNEIKENISHFFCILDSINQENAWLDISVISAPIIENLVYDEDYIGLQVLPIAKLDYGNYLALNYNNTDIPYVCVYDFEESEEFNPVTYFISNSFEEFIKNN